MITTKQAEELLAAAEALKAAGESYATYVFDRHAEAVDELKKMIKDGNIIRNEFPRVECLLVLLDQVVKRQHLR